MNRTSIGTPSNVGPSFVTANPSRNRVEADPLLVARLRLEPVGLSVELARALLEGVDGLLVGDAVDEPAAAGSVLAELGAGLGVHGRRTSIY